MKWIRVKFGSVVGYNFLFSSRLLWSCNQRHHFQQPLQLWRTHHVFCGLFFCMVLTVKNKEVIRRKASQLNSDWVGSTSSLLMVKLNARWIQQELCGSLSSRHFPKIIVVNLTTFFFVSFFQRFMNGGEVLKELCVVRIEATNSDVASHKIQGPSKTKRVKERKRKRERDL